VVGKAVLTKLLTGSETSAQHCAKNLSNLTRP
jgi:hypothetical protein